MRDRPSDTAHRASLEAKLGRRLLPGEDADHIDADKTNNSPANLQPLDHAAHSAKSGRTRGLGQLRKALSMVRDRRKLY